MGYSDFLKKYGSNNITRKDVRDFAEQGGSQKQVQKYLKKAEKGKQGFKGTVGQGALDAASKTKLFTKDKGFDEGKDYDYGPLGPGMTPPVFETLKAETLLAIQGQNQIDFANVVGANNQLVQTLISESNDYGNQLNLKGTKYSADRSLDIANVQAASEERWRKYIADVEADSALNVQTLKNQGAVDLQSIVNSGLTDVANIQGAYGSERVQLQGEYDVERANIQSDFEKFKAARSKEGQMYGSLFAGFWN